LPPRPLPAPAPPPAAVSAAAVSVAAVSATATIAVSAAIAAAFLLIVVCHRCCLCRHRSCLRPPLPPLLSAGAIVNVAATAIAAPIPSAVIAATAAYFSAAVTTAFMSQRFLLPLCFNVSTTAAAAASVLIAIATIVLACRLFGASGGW
jgi:hypothetical protein